jgi:trans-aconitate 2-methyltransferase
MRETLENGGPGGRSLGTAALRRSVARRPVEKARTYYDLLARRTRSLDIWETEYLQALDGPDPVLEWVKGTGLRPILLGLDEPDLETFLAEYARRLREAYPAGPDGRTLYPFRRLFIVATV